MLSRSCDCIECIRETVSLEGGEQWMLRSVVGGNHVRIVGALLRRCYLKPLERVRSNMRSKDTIKSIERSRVPVKREQHFC